MIFQQKKDHSGKKSLDPSSLEVPSQRWGPLETDFIVSFPKTKKWFDTITTWVHLLSRRVNFIPCKSYDTSLDVSHEFFTNIIKLHESSENIVSDRDPKFISKFWDRVMENRRVGLEITSIIHPQTDTVPELMNRMVDNYLHCYLCYHDDDWYDLLPSAVLAYISSIIDDSGMSTLEVDFG